jgi:nitrile hydratase beta subunit
LRGHAPLCDHRRVNGVHDLGGTHGYGAVPLDGETFHEEWEKHLFGLRMGMNVHGIPGGLDELRYAVESLPPEVYVGAAPFERWLISGEDVYIRHGWITADEVEAWRERLREQPETPMPRHEDAAFVETVLGRLRGGRSSRRTLDAEPRFAVGDAVRTRNVHTTEHTRLPRYLRAKQGVIDRLHGGFDLPERAAVGIHEPEHVYEVRFTGGEVWGESAEPNTTYYAQLWESYLVPA